jgi:signal transduction histidine kinase
MPRQGDGRRGGTGSRHAAPPQSRTRTDSTGASYLSPVQVAERRERLIAFMRLLLALSGLLVESVDPAEPDRFVAATYAALSVYCGYATLIYLAASGGLRLPFRATYWLDAAWFTVLVALGNGTNSIFFFGFFFAILAAAFGSGRTAGLRVTGVSVVLFGVAAYAFNTADSLELNRFLIRPASLLILGYMISDWGGFQLSLVRRLAVLRDVAELWNPRFGIDRTVANVLERLCAFYRCESAVIVVPGPQTDTAIVRRSASVESPLPANEVVPFAAVAPLLAFDPRETFGATRSRRGMKIVRATPDSAGPVSEDAAGAAAELLNAASFMTVPWRQRQTPSGRLFLSFTDPAVVGRADLDFLAHAISQMMPIIDNVQLLDRLATEAADTERQRIAHDLHDSVIQPYIGLRMGVQAIREKANQEPGIKADLERLEAMMQVEIAELRRYMSGLRTPAPHQDACVDALNRYLMRYTDATGIAVHLDVPEGLQLNDRLSAEVFQIVVEALSNVRRHTESSRVTVSVRTTAHHVFVRVEDTGTPGQPAARFTPRSLAERVLALDGQWRVVPNGSGGSTLELKIPL